MRLWQDELLWRIKAASNEETLFDMARDEAKKLGFDHCAYGLQLPLSVTARRIVMLNSYPVVWQKRYMEENYLAIDPLVLHGSRSVMPIVWNEDLFSEARNFWEDAKGHGLRFGWAQSCTNMQGIRGMLTLARCAESLSEAELQKNGYRMVWLTQIVHQCMSTLIAADLLSDLMLHRPDFLQRKGKCSFFARYCLLARHSPSEQKRRQGQSKVPSGLSLASSSCYIIGMPFAWHLIITTVLA